MGGGRRRRVLVVPDKFKGTLSAAEVAEAVAVGLRAGDSTVEVSTAALADGGEGSVAAARDAGFAVVPVVVSGPTGEPVGTEVAVRGETAVVEAAGCCGLARLPGGIPAPLTASSHGVGEAVAAAVAQGAGTVVLALGGVATTDGGAGFLSALGARLRTPADEPVSPGGVGLAELVEGSTVDVEPARRRLGGVKLVVATDVDNPLLGPNGAAAVYGPQKGADPGDVARLDAALDRFVRRLGAVELAGVAGAGAAGGLGFAALLLGGRIRSGADYFLGLLGIDARLGEVDAVITGEGSLDVQSLAGKLPIAVARAAAARGVPVHAVAGRCTLTAAQTAPYFRSVHTLAERAADTAGDAARSVRLLTDCGRAIATVL